MEQRILTYRKYMDELLKSTDDKDWKQILKSHLIQIGFFQHERLIHLIVTVLFAIGSFLSIFVFLFQFSFFLLALIILLLVLFVPYIRHYYILENEVQKMYTQYDLLLEKCGYPDMYSKKEWIM